MVLGETSTSGLTTFPPRHIAKIQIAIDLRGNTIQLLKDEVPMKFLTWLVIISSTLIPFITEISEGIISYNPERVMRQLGYDHLVGQVMGEMGYSSLLTAEAQFTGEVKEHIF